MLGFSKTESPRYFKTLCAFLEPMALEPVKTGPFSYIIPDNVTKYLMASFFTRIGSTGRFEIRALAKPTALRGVTLNGVELNKSTALILDPTLATYVDPVATYYERLAQLDELKVRTIDFTAGLQDKPFLAGPYGGFITNVTFHDMTWIAAICNGGGWNLNYEIDDSDTMRLAYGIAMPVSKLVVNRLDSGNATVIAPSQPPMGTVSYVLVPASWSSVIDNNVYLFRDDFMESSLNTTSKWNRIQSTTGNMEIDTAHQWIKCTGNTAWNTNTITSQTSVTRAAGKKLEVDVFIDLNSSGPQPRACVGFSDGGTNYTNFVHAINFANTSITIFENGNIYSTSGTYTQGCSYRIRITLNPTGAKYEIQGGTQYPAMGSPTWTDITPPGSSSSNNTLHAGVSAFDKTIWASDLKIY